MQSKILKGIFKYSLPLQEISCLSTTEKIHYLLLWQKDDMNEGPLYTYRKHWIPTFLWHHVTHTFLYYTEGKCLYKPLWTLTLNCAFLRYLSCCLNAHIFSSGARGLSHMALLWFSFSCYMPYSTHTPTNLHGPQKWWWGGDVQVVSVAGTAISSVPSDPSSLRKTLVT